MCSGGNTSSLTWGTLGSWRCVLLNSALSVISPGVPISAVVSGGDFSAVVQSWRLLRRKRRPATSTSYERLGSVVIHLPSDHSLFPGSFMRIACPDTSGDNGWLLLSYRCFWLRLCWSSLLAVCPSISGFKSFLCIGRSVRVRRPIRRCTGDVPVAWLGVFRQSNSAKRGSLSAFAFFKSALQTFTAFSALPFDWIMWARCCMGEPPCFCEFGEFWWGKLSSVIGD